VMAMERERVGTIMDCTTARRRDLTRAMMAFLDLSDKEVETLCGMVEAKGLADMDGPQLDAVCQMTAIAQAERKRRGK
jgi:hypothetical protein